MKYYLAHTITAMSGGNLIGIFTTPQGARDALIKYYYGKVDKRTVDWSHFIRVIEVDKPCEGILTLPRISTEDYIKVRI